MQKISIKVDYIFVYVDLSNQYIDVFLNNKEAVLEVLGRFSEDLTALQRAIRKEDGDYLYQKFDDTRAMRKAIIDEGQA